MCPEKATQTPTETVRILVVDDEILIRESLAECLCGEGFEATVAASAVTGIITDPRKVMPLNA